ncbi:DciA family protein [Teichococcus aestuarii]|uniref:DciA family protein n=1 Tax=Teichococcus aestuarii TaxID=568898 RepID=UPI00361D128A
MFRRRSPAATHLMTDWPEIVGPVLAAQSMPQKLVGGTLTLGCAGPMAMELQYRRRS